MLKLKDVEGMTVVDDMNLEAHFSAPPTVTAKNVKLYEGDTYDRFRLDIQVSDLDSPGLAPVVDDSGVDTSKPGTYQVKISVKIRITTMPRPPNHRCL